MQVRTSRHETVIIGGGQAGLAVGYHLQRRDRDLLIVDANERIGDSWRKRWQTLRLYTPARFDGLPGMPFPAHPWAFPSGLEMADYLEAYASHFELPVRTRIAVDGLERNEDGFVVCAGENRFEADNVVVATGVFELASVPEFASQLDPAITQLHSADYRGPDQLTAGRVLVVGAAHSGGDIAYELARAGHSVVLSGRDTGQLRVPLESRRGRIGFRVLGFVWTRVLTVSTPLGRKVKPEIRSHGGPLLRVKGADLAAAGVERVLERTVGVENGRPVLAGGRVLDVENVVWCTGFRNDYSWMRFALPVEDDGYPEQRHGAAPSIPGLYFAGLPFLHSFASMLVLGAGRDGKRVAEHIAARGQRSPDPVGYLNAATT